MMRHQSRILYVAMHACAYARAHYVEWSISSFITERILMKLAPNDSYNSYD